MEDSALEDLETEIARLETALAAKLWKDTWPPKPSAQHRLATRFGLRFDMRGDIVDLESSTRLLQESLQQTQTGDADEGPRWSDLGLNLLKLHQRSGEPEQLDAALQAFEASLAAPYEPTRHRPWARQNLAEGLLERYRTRRQERDLHRAIDVLETGAQDASLPPDLRLRWTSSLGNAYLERFSVSAAESDLQRSREELTSAIGLAGDSPVRPKLISHLGNVYHAGYERFGRSEDLSTAIDCFRKATLAGLETSPETALQTGIFWGDWASRRGSWTEAGQAYSACYRALDQLLLAQPTRTAVQSWLRTFQGVAARAAHAFVQLGDLQSAVGALEDGNGRWLAEVARAHGAQFQSLKDLAPGLYGQYVRAQAKVHRLRREALRTRAPGRLDDPGLVREIRSAMAQLRRVTQEIRGLEGFESVSSTPELTTLQATLARWLKPSAAVYLFAVRQSSTAVVLTAGSARAIRLPVGYDLVTESWQADDGAPADDGARSPIPSSLLQILGRDFAGPIARELRNDGVDHLVFIPVGLLAQLPFHAASYPVNDRDLTWLDEWSVSWAPNLSILDAVTKGAHRRHRTLEPGKAKALLVANPRPDSQPLAHAEAEAQWLLVSLESRFETKGWIGEPVTLDAILRHLPCARLIHLACHGSFDSEDPLASGVQLSEGTRLQLREILTNRAALELNASLVVLSSCESSVHEGRVIPDEFEGLPAGFLQAGVPRVLGSLWQVDDASTALLMIEFYRGYLEGRPAAEALRDAQTWLRDLTAEELRRHVAAFRTEDAPASLRRLAAEESARWFDRGPAERPYADAFFWAGFILTGIH